MSKYNEVMEKVKVSKDMRDRILSGVEKELEQDAKSIAPVTETTDKKRFSKIVELRRYAGIAAAFVILFVGAAAVLKIRSLDMTTSSEMMVEEASMVNQNTHKAVTSGSTSATMDENAASIERKEFSSLLKLNAEAGVTFKEIQYLDSFSSSKDYYLYDGKIGVINYDVEGNTVTVRQMSTEFGESIPDKYIESLIERQNSKAITAGGKSVTISGKDDLYTVAEWSDDELVFQLESTDALTLQDMKDLMEQVLE